MEEYVNKPVGNKDFLWSQASLMKAIMLIPHISCECLSSLKQNFYSKIEWPRIEKKFINRWKYSYCCSNKWQKRGLISTKKDISEIDATKEAQKIDNVEKTLEIKVIKKYLLK